MQNGIGFSILVVEDDEDDRFIMDEAFKEIGYEMEVRKFIDAKSLLHYLDSIDSTTYPSLILMDNSLPDMDATDLLSILKASTVYKSIPVVVYSTSVSPSKKEQLLLLGAYAYLQKTSSVNDLISLVKELRSIAEQSKGE